MTTTTVAAADTTRPTDTRIISLVSAAHFASHVFILTTAPLFPFIRADFNVTYTDLGIALAIFNAATMALQTPAGFLVDRFSARAVLIGGLLLSAFSLAGAALASSFWLFAAMIGLCGVANAIYHPADYALLSNRVSAPRMSTAYSIHIFAGFIGTAIAPGMMLILSGYVGWRGAFITTAAMGAIIAACIMLFGATMAGRDFAQSKADAETAPEQSDWRVLLTRPVLLSFCFYGMLSMVFVGVQNYGIVALQTLWGMPLSLATTALSVYLMLSAFAVLAGGYVSARSQRNDLIAVVGLTVSAIAMLPLAFFDVGTVLLLGLMGISGFFLGVMQPSRDMLVRAATPPGAFGRVFGFVTTGFNVAAIIGAPLFGAMMDYGAPAYVLIGAAFFALLAVPTVIFSGTGRRPGAA